MPARLAQHLASRALLSQKVIDEALRRRASSGGALDTALLEMNAIAEQGLLQALADVSGLRPVNLADFEPNIDISRFVPANVADRLGVVPLSVDDGTLHIASIYPPARKELDEVAVLLGKRLELWVAVESRVREWISTMYGVALSARHSAVLYALDPNRRAQPPPEADPEPAPTPEATTSGTSDSFNSAFEDSVSSQMVEQIARAVAEEPILLEVRKKPAQPVVSLADDDEFDSEPLPLMTVRNKSAGRSETQDQWHLISDPIADPPLPAHRPPPSIVIFPNPPKAEKTAKAVETPKPIDDAANKIVAETANKIVDETPSKPEIHPERSRGMRASPDDVVTWTLEEARAALKAASVDRDKIVNVALEFGRRTFDFVAAFAILRGTAVGWNALGEGAENFKATASIPLDAPSVFRTVSMMKGSYVGPVPADVNTTRYLETFRRTPRTLFLFPIELRNRLVVLFYGDSGPHPISQRRLSEYLIFCQEISGAFQALLLGRKQKYGTSAKRALSLDEVVKKPGGLGWSPLMAAAKSGAGKTNIPLAMENLPETGERPMGDLSFLIEKLTSPDTSARTEASELLASMPRAAAQALVGSFPGPTVWPRTRVDELPEPEELGPLPSMLVRLGRAGADALAPLLESEDSDTRYYALLTAGSLPYASLVPGVSKALFDFEPDISSAARVTARAIRHVPPFDKEIKVLRTELAANDSMRRALAARALGTLHDRGSLEALINLVDSKEPLSSAAAAEALREITKLNFGTDRPKWLVWFSENRIRGRGEWLIHALKSDDKYARASAIEELSKTLNDDLGYSVDGTKDAREASAARWEAALKQNPRLKHLE